MTIPVGHREVKTVVHRRLGLGSPLPVFEGVEQTFRAVRNGEVDNRRHSATRSRSGAAPPVVVGNRSAKRKLQVDVNVDRTWHQIEAGAVDNLACLARQRTADRRNPLTFNGNVLDPGRFRTEDGCVGNHQVVSHGSLPLLRGRLRLRSSVSTY